ncbi:hypothetical protein [Flavobacterium sp.]|uniref:hypothetical protein n=1 Tax=Flavobacterium sp. TaxID=239 RepID=UPI002623D8D9|nr:hypothetical protein [Flavobacterium sp.]
MKKLFFGLIATVMFGFVGNAQSNSKNEYDYLGVIHNEVLSEFFKQFKTPNMSIEEILTKIKPVVLENQKYKSKFGSKYYAITTNQVKQYMPDIANNFNTLVDDQKLSFEAKEFLKELLNSFEGATDFDKIYKNVISLEDRIIASKISNSEKEFVLGATSIARYSSYLWLVENPNPTFTNSLSGRFRWWSIVADIAGGVLGIPGGAAGIAAGAVATSAVSEAISNKP